MSTGKTTASYMSWMCSSGKVKTFATARRLSGAYASHTDVQFTDISYVGFGGEILV
jgi:hypothetical protein